MRTIQRLAAVLMMGYPPACAAVVWFMMSSFWSRDFGRRVDYGHARQSPRREWHSAKTAQLKLLGRLRFGL